MTAVCAVKVLSSFVLSPPALRLPFHTGLVRTVRCTSGSIRYRSLCQHRVLVSRDICQSPYQVSSLPRSPLDRIAFTLLLGFYFQLIIHELVAALGQLRCRFG